MVIVDGVGALDPAGLHAVFARGRSYLYHRATGARLTAGVTVFGPGRFQLTQAAAAALADLNAGAEASAEAARAARPGSLGALFDAWTGRADGPAAPEFARLRPRTRADYVNVCAWIAPAGAARGDFPLARITPPFVVRLRDAGAQARGRRFGNYVVSVLASALAWARLRGYVRDNAAAGVPAIPRPSDAPTVHRPWTLAERAAVEADFAAHAPHLLLPFALARYAALRQGDVLRLPATAWDGRTLDVGRAAKNGEPIRLDPPPKALAAALAAAAAARAALAARRPTVLPARLCLNAHGRAWSADGAGLRASFFKRLRALEAAGAIGPGLTFHGLRHTVAFDLAEAGADWEVLKAILGDRSDAAAKAYVRDAGVRRRRAAGVAALDSLNDREEPDA